MSTSYNWVTLLIDGLRLRIYLCIKWVTISVVSFCSLSWVKTIKFSGRKLGVFLWVNISVDSLRPFFLWFNLGIKRITVSVILLSSFCWVERIQLSSWKIWVFLRIKITVNSLWPFLFRSNLSIEWITISMVPFSSLRWVEWV